MLHRFLGALRKIPIIAIQRLRIWKFYFLSDAPSVFSEARYNQPVLLTGLGKIQLYECNLGVWPSPYFLSGYIHIEARNRGAEVCIKSGAWINNNAVIIAEHSRIEIGENTLIGPEFMAVDSDFHDLDPDKRLSGKPKYASITIGRNVFIGARVTILKGVTIGENSVVGAGSLVEKDIPPNVIASGVPAKVIKSIEI